MEKEILFGASALSSNQRSYEANYEEIYRALKKKNRREYLIIKATLMLTAAVFFFGTLFLVSKI